MYTVPVFDHKYCRAGCVLRFSMKLPFFRIRIRQRERLRSNLRY